MLWPEMTTDQLELLDLVVDRANGAAYDLDVRIEITDKAPDHYKIAIVDEDGETTLVASVRVLGDYSYVDRRVEGDKHEMVENTLLGVLIDGDDDKEMRWRIVDARGSSLFAILYV